MPSMESQPKITLLESSSMHMAYQQTNLYSDSATAAMSRDLTIWSQTVADISANEMNLTTNETKTLSELTIWLRHIEPFVLLYTTVIIATVGVTGNLLSLVVFVLSPNFRRLSTIQFLIALTITDSLYLVGDLFFAMSRLDWDMNYITPINFVDSSDLGCKTVMWLRYSTKMMSAWITVMITLERLLAVALPLRVSSLSTPFRARVLTILLCSLCIPLTSYPLWTLSSIPYGQTGVSYCQWDVTGSGNSYPNWLLSTNVIGSVFIPSTLLIVFTAIILVFLGRSRRLRHESANYGRHHESRSSQSTPIVSTSEVTDRTAANQLRHPLQSSSSENRQLTVMLSLVSVTALTLQLPYIVCYIVKNSGLATDDAEFQARLNLAYSVTQLCSLLNYAINILLYCISGSKFRQRIVELAKSCRSYRCSNQFEENTGHLSNIFSLSSTNFRKESERRKFAHRVLFRLGTR